MQECLEICMMKRKYFGEINSGVMKSADVILCCELTPQQMVLAHL